MEIIGCGKGHYYNPELYSSCPECAKENSTADYLGVTEPVDFNNYAGNANNIGSTEPVEGAAFSGGHVDNIGATEPVYFNGFAGNSGTGSTEPVNKGYGNVMNTSDFKDSYLEKSGSKVQDYGKTMPVTPSNVTFADRGGVPFTPVVGWLVCIDGPAKGRDYRIHSHYNYIGRGQHMDICISGDDCISTDRAAVIAYDTEEKFFSFGPSMGHNVVRVNGKMLMNAVVLNAYDELTIGKTKLLFVPLCGERFDWNDK